MVRQKYPNFTFMAEVYWDLEWTLQHQGFDYCYDKRLYDRLKQGLAMPVRDHLRAGLDYQERLARFLENHDEPRAAAEFSWSQHQAAAIVTFLGPGLRFFHQGQFEGAQVRVPVHLCRGPVEAIDRNCVGFYASLLRAIKDNRVFREGTWSQIDPQEAWPGNPTAESFIAYAWVLNAGDRHVVVVNYAGHQGQCRLKLPFPELHGRQMRLTDIMGTEIYLRDGSEIISDGLFIDHAPWHFNVFKLEVM